MSYTYDDFDSIGSWWDLKDFCEEYGLETNYTSVDLDEIVDDYWLKERVQELASDCQWNEIDTLVSGLSDSRWEDGIYHDRGYGLEELDYDYFDETKEEVLAAFREEGYYFDDEEDEDDEDDSATSNGMFASRYTGGVRSVYGNVFVQDCYDQPDVVGCSAEDFGKFFGF